MQELAQALQILRQAASQAPLPLQGHEQVQKASQIIENALADYEKMKGEQLIAAETQTVPPLMDPSSTG